MIEALDDPVTVRLVARKLALPAFPIQGAACSTFATTIGHGDFGSGCSPADTGDYTFSKSKVAVGTTATSEANLTVDAGSAVSGRIMGSVLATAGNFFDFSAGTGDLVDSPNLLGHLRFSVDSTGPLKSSLLIYVNTGGSALAALKITNVGNVGIGTTTPLQAGARITSSPTATERTGRWPANDKDVYGRATTRRPPASDAAEDRCTVNRLLCRVRCLQSCGCGARIWAPTAIILLLSSLAQAQGGTWATRSPMSTARCCLAVAVANRNLYAIGGEVPERVGANVVYSTVEAYDPITNTWATKSPMPTPRYTAGAAVVDGVIYVLGGADSSNHASGVVEAYDPKTDTWTPKPAMPTPRSGLAVALLSGILYAIGGVRLGPDQDFDVVEAYDPRTNTWTTKAHMRTRRHYAAAGVIGGLIYVAGGENFLAPSVPAHTAALEAYDPNTDSWSTKAPMPLAVRGAAAAVIAGKLYVAGGSLDDEAGSQETLLQVYDPQFDTWELGPPMPTPRVFPGADVIEDTMYVVGGYPALTTNEAFSPFLTVAIDIKPGDPNNVINIKSAGVVPVAILGSATFDATTVDPTTVTLAGAPVALRGNGKPMTAVADANNDGFPDLLLYFRTQKLNLTPADTEAVLYGKTFSGQAIRGSDKVKVIAPPAPSPN